MACCVNLRVPVRRRDIFLCEGLLPAGFTLAVLEHTLAPAVRLDQIVGEVRQAVAWVIDHAKEFGDDPPRVFVSGHSAGGHLTTTAITDLRVAGGIAISGIYDLEPIRLSYLNEKLRLDVAEARRLHDHARTIDGFHIRVRAASNH